MPSLLVRQRVRNYPEWLSHFASRAPTRQADGALGERIFRNVNDPEEVFVLLEWDDLDRATLFVHSDDLRQSMAFIEVTEHPHLWFLLEDPPGQE